MSMSTETHPPRQPIPPHVDPRLVLDYNVYDGYRPEQKGHLHEALYQMGEEVGRGMFWTPRNGGHWCINSHELLFEAVRNTELFSSSKMTLPPMPEGAEPRLIPLTLDPPEHGAFRMPLMKALAPSVIMKMEAGIRALASRLIGNIVETGSCDFVEAVGEPVPVTVFMTMMGMPLARMAEFRDWMLDMASDNDTRRASAFTRIADMMGGLISERMAERKEDLISRLIDADIDGRPPTFEELQNYCMLLFSAGLDTLVNAFTFGAYQLAVDPELQERVKADPELVPPLVEEVLRRYAIAMPPRIVMRDADFGGVHLKAGDRVLLMLPAGNLDPQTFNDPIRFDIDRASMPHLTFNSGPHRCVGSHLARLELRVFFEEWLRLMPIIRLDPEVAPVYRPGLTLTMAKLPILWDDAHGHRHDEARRAAW